MLSDNLVPFSRPASSPAPAPTWSKPFYVEKSEKPIWRVLAIAALICGVLCLVFLTGCVLPGTRSSAAAAPPPQLICTPIGRIPIANDKVVPGEFLRSVKLNGTLVQPCMIMCDDGSLRWTDVPEVCE